MKKCKACQSEIDEKATICLHCRTKQPVKVGKVTTIVATIIIAFIVLKLFSSIGSDISLIGSDNSSKNTSITTTNSAITPTIAQPSPTEKQIKIAKIGETVIDGDLEFTVQSVKTTNTLGSFYTEKKAQGMFYVVTLHVKNTGKDTKTIDSSEFQLRDNQGRNFDRSIDGQTALGFTQGHIDLFLQQIQPSLSVTGDLVFDAPTDAKGLKLIVKGGLFSKGLPIDLGK